jgi:hypothetical protein
MIRTGLGIHGGANAYFPMGETEQAENEFFQRLEDCGFSAVKLLNVGKASALRCVQKAVARGIEPIVRCYRPEPHASTLDADPDQKATLHLLVEAGCKLYEVQNEPNVVWEWPGKVIPSDAHEVTARTFAADADFILSLGATPLITAMAPGGEPGWDDITFLQHMVWWLKDNWGLDKLARCGIAVHTAALNHPLDYPFDDVNQKGVPVTDAEWNSHEWAGGREFVDQQRRIGMNAGQKLLDPGASNCWLKWQAVHDLVLRETGLSLDVYGTEGGIWVGELQDPRYPKVSVRDVTDGYLRIAQEMMGGEYPDWFKCTGFWLMANRGAGNPDMSFEYSTWWNVYQGEQPWATAYRHMEQHDRMPYQGTDDTPVEPEPLPTQLTDVQIAEVCEQAGFMGDSLEMAIAVCLAESGGRTDAVNVTGNTPPSRDRGLFQINDFWHSEVSDDCAFDAQCNVEAAYKISESGTNWNPWSAYQAGTYVDYLDRAEEAAAMTPLAEAIRNAAWLQDRAIHGIPYNPDAAFPKYAREHSLGAPLTGEWGVMVAGVQYMVQAYVLGIVYAIAGDWANVRSVEW